MNRIALSLTIGVALLAGKVQAETNAELIKRGEYLTIAADCIACHKVSGGQPFAGGLPFETPMGTIYSPNITPDRETGIGNWSDEDFLRALHDGIAQNGQRLYPAFPYTSYTLLKDEDVKAIRAYLFSLPPIKQQTPKTDMAFPFNQRWGMWFWNLFNFDGGRFMPDQSKSEEWNRGAYLVEALEHCGECHSPRNFMMGVKDSRRFSGELINGWQAYNITSDNKAGIGSWDQQELIQYLKTGHINGKAQAAGPMGEAVENSLQHLTDPDLQAIAVYVLSLKAENPDNEKVSRFDMGKPAQDVVSLRGESFELGEDGDGARLFLGNCASCHGVSGQGGPDGYYPSLVHNSVLGAPTANNLIKVILDGVDRKMATGHVFMPGFSERLNERQVSELANYLFKQFGRESVSTTPKEVKDLYTPAEKSENQSMKIQDEK